MTRLHFFRPLIFFICFVAFKSGYSQEKILDFYIVYNEKVYGTLGITMTENNDVINYFCETSVEAEIFFKHLKIDYNYNTTFKNGILERSDVKVDLDGKIHTETITIKKKNGYTVIKDKDRVELETDIPFTSIMLYFFEPKDQDVCYSEQLGEFNQIKQVAEHTYVKFDMKKRANRYFYEDGLLKTVEVDGGPVNFLLLAKD